MAAFTTLLAVGSLVAGLASSAVQMQAGRAAASAQAEQANQQAQYQYAELGRQQERQDAAAKEQKSDRMRKADAELATLRVQAGEQGQNFDRMALNIGYVEGLDLSRIESNRRETIDSLQSQKTAAYMSASNAGKSAAASARNSTIGAGLQFAGTALSVGQSYFSQQERLKAIEKSGRTSTGSYPS